MNNDNFYHKLPCFKNFNGITDHTNFVQVPDSWKVIITDIKGSTAAIEKGRYRDVNTIGAAAIVSTRKGMGNQEFPFVFGGDGATILIPQDNEESVIKELLSLKKLAKDQYGLDLRVGVISVAEIIQEGGHIDIAKFELLTGKCIAIFNGGGLILAENKVKQKESQYQAIGNFEDAPDLTALSCRWKPIPSKQGIILSLLVESKNENQSEVYKNFLNKLDQIFEGHLEKANPVNMNKARYKSIIECILNEKLMFFSIFTKVFINRVIEIIGTVLIFKYHLFSKRFNSIHYTNAIKDHSDYRKFDDMLRMVIDCNETQVNEIKEVL